MKGILSHVRLLPAVILVGMALLGVKGESLIHSAWARDVSATPSEASVLANDTAPVAKDATDDEGGATSSEVDVLTGLAKRRAALDAREADLNMRAQVLAAAEARVDSKISTLKQMQDQMNTLLQQRDADEKQQLASLVKTYSAMRPRDAARIFDNLPDDVLVPVAQAMKSDALAPVLAAMNPDAAQKLTTKLAGRLKLPDTAAPAAAAAPTTTASAPTPAPAAPSSGPQAAAPKRQ
ncbi:MAG: hypothetical protein KGJ78_04360 [Alphaproteobacteria bacterium]|nr:hypothetical protein [Alphaproteobacteria bacterium]